MHTSGSEGALGGNSQGDPARFREISESSCVPFCFPQRNMDPLFPARCGVDARYAYVSPLFYLF